MPPDLGNGSAIFGLHLYSWTLLVFCAEILAVGVNLLLAPKEEFTAPPALGKWIRRVFTLFGVVITAFAVATFVEEGLHLILPDDPVSNRLFEDLGLRGS